MLGPCWGLKPPWTHPKCLPRRASEPDPAQTLKMAPRWGPQTSKMAPKWGRQTSKMSSLNTCFKSIFPSRGAHQGTQNDHELLKLHSLLCWSTFFTRIWCWAGGVTRSAKKLNAHNYLLFITAPNGHRAATRQHIGYFSRYNHPIFGHPTLRNHSG